MSPQISNLCWFVYRYVPILAAACISHIPYKLHSQGLPRAIQRGLFELPVRISKLSPCELQIRVAFDTVGNGNRD